MKSPDYFLHDGTPYLCVGNDEGKFWTSINGGESIGFEQGNCTPLYASQSSGQGSEGVDMIMWIRENWIGVSGEWLRMSDQRDRRTDAALLKEYQAFAKNAPYSEPLPVSPSKPTSEVMDKNFIVRLKAAVDKRMRGAGIFDDMLNCSIDYDLYKKKQQTFFESLEDITVETLLPALSTPPQLREGEVEDGWVKDKPKDDKEFVMVTATKLHIPNEWDYKFWEVRPVVTEDGFYYGLHNENGDEWGDYDDLTADLYKIIPNPPKQ